MSGFFTNSILQLALSFAAAFIAAFLVAQLTAHSLADDLLWFGASLAAAVVASGLAVVVLRRAANRRH